MKFLSKLFKRRGEEGASFEEGWRYLQVEKRVARWLVENRSVFVPLDVLAEIVRDVFGEGADPRAVASRLPLFELRGGLYLYAPLLDVVEEGRGLEAVRAVVDVAYGRVGLDCLQDVVAAVIRRYLGHPLERGNARAWYHAALLYSFPWIADEEVRREEGGARVLYRRVGGTWVMKRYGPGGEEYCDYATP